MGPRRSRMRVPRRAELPLFIGVPWSTASIWTADAESVGDYEQGTNELSCRTPTRSVKQDSIDSRGTFLFPLGNLSVFPIHTISNDRFRQNCENTIYPFLT